MSDLQMKTTVCVSTVDLRRLLNELDHLRRQRDDLQADNSRLVLENRELRGRDALANVRLLDSSVVSPSTNPPGSR